VRIGIVTEYYYPSIGGVQEHVHHFAREARRLGHAVKVITSEMPDLEPPEGEAAGPDVIRIGTSRPIYNNGTFGRTTQGWSVRRRMRALFEREQFDVVHVHCPLTPTLPYIAIHEARCPVVGTFHSNWKPAGPIATVLRHWQQRYLDRLDAAVAVSRACFLGLEGRLTADFHIIPNGVDLEEFGRGKPLARFDDEKLTLLWVGRLEPRNGLDHMLRVFSKVRKDVDARLLVVGDGQLRPHFERMVPPEVARDVVFAGRLVDERPDWYASADIYCAPTHVATFGITLLEAMAAGCPILASDIDGFREVMQHGREGEMLPVHDERAWVSAIRRLADEPLRGAAYAERGRKTAHEYAWPTVTRQVIDLYRRIGVGSDHGAASQGPHPG
jgi:phosphatidylinositol alpha-mannosyltransferase